MRTAASVGADKRKFLAQRLSGHYAIARKSKSSDWFIVNSPSDVTRNIVAHYTLLSNKTAF